MLQRKKIDIEQLRAALTVVIDNTIIVPEIDSDKYIMDYAINIPGGFLWKYNDRRVLIDIREIFEYGKLDECVEKVRSYVVKQLNEIIVIGRIDVSNITSTKGDNHERLR